MRHQKCLDLGVSDGDFAAYDGKWVELNIGTATEVARVLERVVKTIAQLFDIFRVEPAGYLLFAAEIEPAQIVNALHTALEFLEQEGGPDARLARYMANRNALYDGLIGIGLTPYVGPENQGPIVVNVHAPPDPAWHLQKFVDALKQRGVTISNFYNTPTPGFRAGCIGAFGPSEMRGAVAAMDQALNDIGVKTRNGESK